jgi:hypothetical protein
MRKLPFWGVCQNFSSISTFRYTIKVLNTVRRDVDEHIRNDWQRMTYCVIHLSMSHGATRLLGSPRLS